VDFLLEIRIRIRISKTICFKYCKICKSHL